MQFLERSYSVLGAIGNYGESAQLDHHQLVNSGHRDWWRAHYGRTLAAIYGNWLSRDQRFNGCVRDSKFACSFGISFDRLRLLWYRKLGTDDSWLYSARRTFVVQSGNSWIFHISALLRSIHITERHKSRLV
jgi:hypothetical protein